jgi:hypothetical protein
MCLLIEHFDDEAYIFLGEILGSKVARRTAKRRILQSGHHLTQSRQRGMVLAIPLTQAAVGPFRSV